MVQGKLDVTEKKEKKIIVNVLFENKKGKQTQVPVQNSGITDLTLSGNDIEFEMAKGQVVKIMCKDKEIFSKKQHIQSARNHFPKKQYASTRQNASNYNTKPQTSGQLDINHVKYVSYPAKAPYNFIPLNDKVVEAERRPDFDKYHEERYTGYIDLNIETITPLYIRDTLNKEEMAAEKINSDFFSPGGKPKIPGSTLRGMSRTMVEIVSYGKFGVFDDRHLYFRAVAGMGALGRYYKKVMIDESDNHFPKIEAGMLKKTGHKLEILPSKNVHRTQIYRINYNKYTKQTDGTEALRMNIFDFKEIYFQPVAPQLHIHRMPNGRSHKLRYALLKSVSSIKDTKHPNKGYIIASGEFGRKKHMHWVINDPIKKITIQIPENVVREYQEDVSRKEECNLFKMLEEKNNYVPCFFVRNDNKEVISFGHTGMFRLAYEKSIGDHIPENLKAKDIIDIPEAIFGNAETFAGRVFFEDAVSIQEDVIMEEKIPKILASPKPTTFQHYLVQPYEHGKNRSNYNDTTAIRGNKLYWHQSAKNENWVETDPDKLKNKNIITKIKPVKPKTKFTSRIRFENLSQVELGALLFALDLPEGCCHKLGMGKPLGLGSVKIVPTLHLSNRIKRYENLFDEWNNDIESCQNLAKFKENFQSYVLKHIGESKTKCLWATERLKALKYMLDDEKGIELEKKGKIRYMEITGSNQNEFRDRLILPKPSCVR